jgi:hypothetical protein
MPSFSFLNNMKNDIKYLYQQFLPRNSLHQLIFPSFSHLLLLKYTFYIVDRGERRAANFLPFSISNKHHTIDSSEASRSVLWAGEVNFEFTICYGLKNERISYKNDKFVIDI